MADADPPPGPPERTGSRAIVRAELREVIRRAAELSLNDTDSDEQLSEAEVLRIATELGLPSHHVQRALYELPELRVQERWYDRYYGTSIITVGRVVPAQPAPTLRRIEDYLVTREYLQIVRRRPDSVALMPADDTLSSLARALTRPARRHTLSRASRVVVGVHELPERKAHVRVDVDLTQARSTAVKSGAAWGTLAGIATGSAAAGISAAMLPEFMGIVPHVLAFAGTMAATAAGGIGIAARSFKAHAAAAQMELIGLLDRVETGGTLDPPPAPWRRRLQLRLFGDKH